MRIKHRVYKATAPTRTKMEILPQDNITASQLECGLKHNRLHALKKINADGAYANVLTENTLKWRDQIMNIQIEDPLHLLCFLPVKLV